MDNIFNRNVAGMTEILQSSTIGIAGCGGLGSNAAVSLVRAGIGKLIIVDFDIVEESNLNRQYFFRQDIGKKKVEALKNILLSINPDVELIVHNMKLTKDTVCEIFAETDLLIEAFDKAESKKWLIEAYARHYKEKYIICGNGISGLGKTEELKITQVGKIIFCGDLTTDMKEGLCSSRVAIVANMQANLAIELLVKEKL